MTAARAGRADPRDISIHTSPKGGDLIGDIVVSPQRISIHTSPKGGDLFWRFVVREAIFQSTPPRREVTPSKLKPNIVNSISIHTSPKGGDEPTRYAHEQYRISIHTSPKGGDQQGGRASRVHEISIHTSPKGGDAVPRSTPPPPQDFNPHLPEGR